jgi:hypothetical protein
MLLPKATVTWKIVAQHPTLVRFTFFPENQCDLRAFADPYRVTSIIVETAVLDK